MDKKKLITKVLNWNNKSFLNKQIKEKDINEMILAGKTVDEVLQIINENACSTLKANLRLKEWRKINAV